MGAATIFSMDSRIASMRPPGVFKRTSSNAAFSSLACWIARDRISAVTGWIMPSTSTASTRGAAAFELAAVSASRSRLASCVRTLTLIYLRWETIVRNVTAFEIVMELIKTFCGASGEVC